MRGTEIAARRAWCFPVLLALGSLAGALALTMQSPANGPVALIFPPWWSATKSMLAAAGAGAVIRFGSVPFIVVVIPVSGATMPSGAWLRLDPLHFGGCGLHHS